MKKEEEGSDHTQFGEELSPGRRLIRRRRNGVESLGVISRLEDGKPMQPNTELVSFDKAGDDGWYPTTVLYRNGPPQIATRQYCDGYERIFGKKKPGLA